MKASILLVMGVSGSGKSTVGELLARKLGWSYADADSFHPAANVEKMRAGNALTDEDRRPWLQAIRVFIDEVVAKHQSAVVSCSGLKRSYRDMLRRPEVSVVYLRGTREQIEPRLAARKGHFFKPGLLASQLAALEEPTADEHVLAISIAKAPDEIVSEIVSALDVER